MPLIDKVDKSKRLDRHSGTGLRGLPKKEGAGRFGWGKQGTGEDGEGILDKNDPNYLSDEDEKEIVLSKSELVSPLDFILHEYLASGDIDELVKNIKDHPVNHAYLVKKAVFFAMDMRPFERELVSKLLSTIYSTVLTTEEIQDGFQLALNALDDISLDIPEATDLLSKFLARAVVDEVIPPIFLSQANAKTEKASQALSLAVALSTENHRGERLAHIWGPGDLHSVKRLKEEILFFLKEYLLNDDKTEAEKCLRRLNAPSFHFQVVKQAVRLALEKNSAEATKKIFTLMKYFADVALISEAYFERGFQVTLDSLADLKLDFPNADVKIKEFVETAKSEKWLPDSFSHSSLQSPPPPPSVAQAAS